jgi:NADPH-dependent 2,4-dienoyl-CoA reductase/sulfur reductase-like enzyme
VDKASLDFDIVVVGGGPGGIAAATVAAECRARVAILDDAPWLGGQIWRGPLRQRAAAPARQWLQRLQHAGVTLMSGTSVIAAPARGCLLAESGAHSRTICWKRLVIATGARELFLPFPGWHLPGVIGPGGLLGLAKNGWPVRDKKIVVAGSGPLLLAAAAGFGKLGAALISINEQTPAARLRRFALQLVRFPTRLSQALQLRISTRGAPYRPGVWPVRADGEQSVRRVTLTDGLKTWTEDCDILACAFGLTPNIELPLSVGCGLDDGLVVVDEFQQTTVEHVYCAGEPTGIGGSECAQIQGQIAGYSAAGRQDRARSLFDGRARHHRFRSHLLRAFALRPEVIALADDATILCRCEDVTLGTVRRFASWREAKLHSRCGMGPCQGRVCGAATRSILGWAEESIRPPILPSRVESLISGSRGGDTFNIPLGNKAPGTN